MRQLSASAALRLAELVDAVTDQVRRELPVYGSNAAVSRDDLRASVRANLETVIGALWDLDSADLRVAHETGRRRAQQGVPLPDVLRACRLALSTLWDLMLEIAGTLGETELRALIAAANTFWYFLDEFLGSVTDGYREARTELVRAQQHRRDALLEALFSGAVLTETTLWEVTEQLDLPRDGVFAVVSAETGEFAQRALPGVERMLADRGFGSAWRSTPSYELGIVSLGRTERLPELATVLGQATSVRIGISPVYRCLADTPRAVRLAHVAGASIPLGEARAACFNDSPLSMLVAASPEESASIATRILKPILELPASERDLLLDTLDTWIATGGSTKRAASQLYCHPNTVRYRLQRVQTDLRLSLTDPVGSAQLVIALRAWRLFANVKPLSTLD